MHRLGSKELWWRRILEKDIGEMTFILASKNELKVSWLNKDKKGISAEEI